MKIFQKIFILIISAFIIFLWTPLQVSWLESLEGEQQSEVKKLSLQSVDIVDFDVLKLSFWVEIDDSREKDFIVKSLPVWNEIEVTQITVDNESVLLSIEQDFESEKQYEVVIISLYWTDGSTIVSWIDWAVEFSAPDMNQFNLSAQADVSVNNTNTIQEDQNIDVESNNSSNQDVQPEGNQENTEQNIKVEIIQEVDTAIEPELNSADEKTKTVAETIDEANKKNNWVNLWGKEVSQEELNRNITVAAGKASDLPTTWPEHVFFVMLAVVLAGLIIHIRRKKI